ncbi:transcription termination/antitermination NusG family protein, partial [Agrobacterium vitis]|uniref:transcription termination/antitermination NusG family protein n=1 Tax=Agrobacterium vitis TaxID=373 RepID=UPI00307E93CC
MEKAAIAYDDVVSRQADHELDTARAKMQQHAHDLHQASKAVADSFGWRAGWFCLQVMTGHEFAVLADLAAVDVEAYVPRRPGGEVVRRGRKWQLPERPWMPNYVFGRVYPSLPALR